MMSSQVKPFRLEPNIALRRIEIILLSLLISPHAFAGKNDVVDRVFDFTERVVLVKDKDHFYFEHCLREKCKPVSKVMNRTLLPELTQAIRAERTAKGMKGFPARPQDILIFMNPSAIQSKVYFANSKSPERYNVVCENPELDAFLEIASKSAGPKDWLYRFNGVGKGKFCMSEGQRNSNDVTFAKYLTEVKDLEELYNQIAGR